MSSKFFGQMTIEVSRACGDSERSPQSPFPVLKPDGIISNVVTLKGYELKQSFSL